MGTTWIPRKISAILQRVGEIFIIVSYTTVSSVDMHELKFGNGKQKHSKKLEGYSVIEMLF